MSYVSCVLFLCLLFVLNFQSHYPLEKLNVFHEPPLVISVLFFLQPSLIFSCH